MWDGFVKLSHLSTKGLLSSFQHEASWKSHKLHRMRLRDNPKLTILTALGQWFYCMLMRMGSAVTPRYPGSNFKNKWTPNWLIIFEKWGGMVVSTLKFTKLYLLWRMSGNDENMTFYAFHLFCKMPQQIIYNSTSLLRFILKYKCFFTKMIPRI